MIGGFNMLIFGIIVIILVFLFVFLFLSYNSFVKLNNRVKEAFSTMDVYLKKRWDLIPNLVEVVKGYTKHEADALKEIVELRNSNYDKMSDQEKIKANQSLSNSITKIMGLVENYPDLKANENFLKLQQSLSGIEDEIAQSRKYYNAVVRNYNNKVEMFPSNFVAKLFGFKTKEMFEAKDIERENVKVKI